MKYGLLKYRDNESNIGDYIQSLAAKRFLPRVDTMASREELHAVNEEIFLILNGWFMHQPENWPPNDAILPKFIAFHINAVVSEKMTTPRCIAYYKKHEPIGCRDLYTEQLLKKKGVNAYFSGCLTLTLEKEKYIDPNQKSEIIFCDILYHKPDIVKKNIWKTIRNPHKLIFKRLPRKYKAWNYKKRIINKLVPKEYKNNAITISNQNFQVTTHEEKFQLAEKLLAKYAVAKVVVTSRIHVALPCLAFGTPVVFIHPDRDNSRFPGVIELFHTFTTKQILETPKKELQQLFLEASKKNKELHINLRAKLIKELHQTLPSKNQ